MKLESLETNEVRRTYIEQMIPVMEQNKVPQETFNNMVWFLDQFLSLTKDANIFLVQIKEEIKQKPLSYPGQPTQTYQGNVEEMLPEEEEIEEPLTPEELEARELYQKQMAEETQPQRRVIEEEPPKPKKFNERIRQTRKIEESEDDE